MSVQALTWVLDDSAAEGYDRLVLIAIANEADRRGVNAHPSMETIRKAAKVSLRSALRSVVNLEALGELLVKRPEVRGRGRYNRYALVMGRDPDEVRGLAGWGEWCQPVTIPPDEKVSESHHSANRKGAQEGSKRRAVRNERSAIRPDPGLDPLIRPSDVDPLIRTRARGAGESKSSNPETRDPLLARMVDVCTGRRIEHEARSVLEHLRHHVDDRLIDEAIGVCLELDAPPKFPRYIAEVVRDRARGSIRVPSFDPKVIA